MIELLVVIAIIGILSAIVVASLNIARSKAADANVKQNLSGIRSQAEVVYDSAEPNSYSGLCQNSNVVAALDSAILASGDTASSTDRCFDSDTEWVAYVPLKTDPTLAWCVDSLGAARQISLTEAPTSATTPCPDAYVSNGHSIGDIYSYQNPTLNIDLAPKVLFTPNISARVGTVSVYIKYNGGDANNASDFYWGIGDVNGFSPSAGTNSFLPGCMFHDSQMSSIPNDGQYHLITFDLSADTCQVDTSHAVSYVFGMVDLDHGTAVSDGDYVFHANTDGYPYAIISSAN